MYKKNSINFLKTKNNKTGIQQNLDTEMHALKEHMTQHRLAPDEPIIIDNQWHMYMVHLGGKDQEASYRASYCLMEDCHQQNAIECTYGFIDDIQYTYSSLMNK